MLNRRTFLKQSILGAALFSPLPWAQVWAQDSRDGALKLLKAPKVALVVGNSKYKDAPELKNPANDAAAIAAQLKASGFATTVKLDTGREELIQAIRDYVHAMEKQQAVGLFYFAGHGVQLDWRNYMLPVDAVIDKLEDVAAQSVEIARLMEGLTKAKNPMNVIILDACRENPFGESKKPAQKGLSQMDAPTSTFLAYATSPGNVASDGTGTNGLYTEHLLREMKVPEAKIEEIFKRVPKGNYVIIKGSKTDANSDFLREGYEEVIGAAVAAGDIKIVSETYTDNWDPKNAQATMEQVLTAENNKVDAVLAENDGMAGGVIAALEAQGLAGKVPVSGQDAEQAALNRVALGTQSLSVWKDARELGKAAGEAAVALCSNPDTSAVTEGKDKKKDAAMLKKAGLTSKADKAKFEKMDDAHAKKKMPKTMQEDKKVDAKIIAKIKAAKK